MAIVDIRVQEACNSSHIGCRQEESRHLCAKDQHLSAQFSGLSSERRSQRTPGATWSYFGIVIHFFS